MNEGTQTESAGPSAEAAGSIDAMVEAVLLTSSRPTAASSIAQALAGAGVEASNTEVEQAIERLNESFDAAGRAARIERVAGGFRFMTRAEHAPVLAAIRQQQVQGKLSRAAVETLAIVAYKQPITRADLESIRGVACGEVLRTLMERRLVTIAGRAEEPGRPMLYGTTREFLDQFGLGSLKDLPSVDGGATP